MHAPPPHSPSPRLRKFATQVATPPFLALLAGMAVGLTPLGRGLSQGGGAAAGSLPPELALARGALRSAADVVRMLAGGTLAAQTLVLSASLLQRPEGEAPAPVVAGGGAGGGRGGGGGLAAAARFLLPASALEARALGVVAAVRFLVLPALTVAAARWAEAAGLLPATLATNPVLCLVLLAGSVMPSAQVWRRRAAAAATLCCLMSFHTGHMPVAPTACPSPSQHKHAPPSPCRTSSSCCSLTRARSRWRPRWRASWLSSMRCRCPLSPSGSRSSPPGCACPSPEAPCCPPPAKHTANQ